MSAITTLTPTSHPGACACGAVSFTINAQEPLSEASICHCTLCQAWSGGIFVYVETKDVDMKGTDSLTIWKSSDWAERAFCKNCGSSVYCRITEPGPMEGVYHFGAGTLKDWKDITLQKELFIDRKPKGYAMHGDRTRMTAKELYALWGVPEE